jgi:pimeloyl-ACP methyl ester carboxylesterase
MMAQGMDKWSASTMSVRFFEGEVSPEQWRWFEKVQAEASPEFFIASLEMLGGVDLSDDLSAIAQPVLILGGDSSSATPPSLLDDLRSKLPHACRFFLAPGMGLPFPRGRIAVVRCAASWTGLPGHDVLIPLLLLYPSE